MAHVNPAAACNRPLTDDQRELVVRASRLAWWLAHRQTRHDRDARRADAYHDAAVDGLLHAARYWRPDGGRSWPSYVTRLIYMRLAAVRRWLEERDEKARGSLPRLARPDAYRDAAPAFEAAEEVDALERYAGLTPGQGRAWRLYHGGGLTSKEIAATERVSHQGVETRRRKAEEKLREAARLRGGLGR